MVRVGKARLGGRSPATADNYHGLPAATINRLYATIIHVLLCHLVPARLCPVHTEQIPKVDPQGDHLILFQVLMLSRSGPPHPTKWSYGVVDPITVCEAYIW